jgi:hypothetical protein
MILPRPLAIRRPFLLTALVLLLAWTDGVWAQGPGTAGAQILTLTAGTRAAALAGAYTGVPGDADGIFYNPASAAWLERAFGFGYQKYVEDVVFGSVAGAIKIGPMGLAAGVVYLDAGEIDEIVPDPLYDGERGHPTGATVGAIETAARLAAAVPFLDQRASLAVAAGIFTSDLAGVRRDAAFLDVGGQYRRGALTVGGALRHLGTQPGDDGDAPPLPLEASFGVSRGLRFGERYGGLVAGDVVRRIEERTYAVNLGAEAGFLPRGGDVGAVLRSGVTLDDGEHLGRWRAGGGVGVGGVWLDYTVQTLRYLGMIHRIGVRWSGSSQGGNGV